MVENTKNKNYKVTVRFVFVGVGWQFEHGWNCVMTTDVSSVVDAFSVAKKEFCNTFPDVSAAVFLNQEDKFVFYNYVAANTAVNKK